MPDIFEGKVCPRHDTKLRMRSTRQCRECYLETQRRSKAKNRKWAYDMIYSRLRRQGLSTKHIPPWADLAKIEAIYKQRGPGDVVDHIVPLRGIDIETGEYIICGLHVDYNLKVVSDITNRIKSDLFDRSTEEF